MKMVRNIKMFSFCAFIATVLALACCIPARAGGPYIFIAPFSEGFSYGAMQNLMKDIGKIVTAKTGIQVNLKELALKRQDTVYEQLLKEFAAGRGDFTYFYSQDYVRIAKVREAVTPMFTMTLDGKMYSKVCAYVRKADNLTSMQQLKGKKWGMSGTLATYWLLYKSGIKEEPPKFFSEMKFVVENPTKNLFDALLNKDIDVFIVSHKIVDMALNNDAKYNKAIKALTCAEYDHNMIFSAKKSVPQADMDKIKAAFLNAHKDKAFQSFWFLFKAINGRFVDFDPAALATTQQIVNVATKNHWYEIEKKFITNKGMKK